MFTLQKMIFALMLSFVVLHAQVETEKEIHTFLNNWHHAAAIADAKLFFGSMHKDSVYIGTDATERWSKDVFEKWCIFAFARESAWTFIPLERKIYLPLDNNYAWFDETLDTWMGICRGSGVIVREKKKWKIKHYHLSVTVPNEFVNEFMDLVKQDPYQIISDFDNDRNAEKDIAYAILQAKKNHKDILLKIGKINCACCEKLDAFLTDFSEIKKQIEKNYVVLKITQNNAKILKKYSIKKETSALVILDNNGNLLRSEVNVFLQKEKFYDKEKISAFLKIKKNKN